MRHHLVVLTFYASLGITVSSSPSLPSVPLGKRNHGCIKVDLCKCIMQDGSGVIDLEALENTEGFLERFKRVPFEDAPRDTEVLVSVSPCHPFSEREDFAVTDCTDVAACLIVRCYTNHYVNYGRHKGNKFQYNDTMKVLTVTYSVYSSSEAKTVVHYQCSPNHSISYSQRFQDNVPLQIWVESPCACPNACAPVSVGPGPIFLVILCLSAAAYFVLGSCALRPFRTSSGVQIAPEDSMWCTLCYQLTDQHRPSPA
uniref:Uncharacterized protein n=1 Tax=Electrophorus electricus TaxID=8005 RepID=A0A4W4G065_ELEEL